MRKGVIVFLVLKQNFPLTLIFKEISGLKAEVEIGIKFELILFILTFHLS